MPRDDHHVGLPAEEVRLEKGTALASDGYELAVTRFPAEGRAWATLLCAGAMGVRQDFYAPFARFLSRHGVHVLTFDYRGMGWSRRGSLRGFPATVTDWTDKDFNAMLGEARKAAPDLPLLLLGHSLGGQIFGAAPADVGAKSIGHFGFFSERHRGTLWQEALDWLRGAGAATSFPDSG